ncbi:hypothetical protein [Roseomonas chloroacetimidivorans]|uniref:hypothetical protein n=1 Tax=Roseomonas chloroacetimidivorans TaxID=1766656 RepID=UPI003C74BCF1
MKKPTFSQVLAAETAPAQPEPAAAPAKAKKSDGRKTTTIRISEPALDALKQLALDRKTKLNDLLVSGAMRELEAHGRKPKE